MHADREWCASNAKATQLRVTVVGPEGQVICDSEHDPQTMENHAGRPEIVVARETGFGAQKVRESGIKLWGIVRNPEVLSAFELALHKGQRVEPKVIALEVVGRGEQSLKRFFTLSVAPLKEQNGSIYGAAGIFHDVTEMKSVEQMRIDFVANVSHELRTPLTSIKGYASTIKDDLVAGNIPPENFADAIVRNSDRLMSLLNDLLDLSSIECADVLQRESLDTEEITFRAMRQVEEACKDGPKMRCPKCKVILGRALSQSTMDGWELLMFRRM